MPPGTIILLNGTTSAGKTSIARAVQAIADEPYLHLGADALGSICPPGWAGGTHAEEGFAWVPVPDARPPMTELRPGLYGDSLVSALHHMVATLARLGHNVVVDHILQEPRWLAECVALWERLPVLFVSVRCPLAVAETRERERGDRARGVARWQFERVHAHACYDLEVDTASMSPEACALAIRHRLADGPPPSAFRRLVTGGHAEELLSTPFLRYTGENPEATRRMLDADLTDLAAGPAGDDQRLRLTGRIGESYRMLRHEPEALPYLEQALALARRLGNRPAQAANLIRLATAHQYLGRHAEAESGFREALHLCAEPACAAYEDFAWQHLGKCLVEMNRLREAIDCFERALALRRVKGDPGLLASTEEALTAARTLPVDRP